MSFERRSTQRACVRLPIRLTGGIFGDVRDVSADGLFFEFDGSLEAGRTISLSVYLPDDRRPLHLRARGVVVRVEQSGSRQGVGVRLLTRTLLEARQDRATRLGRASR